MISDIPMKTILTITPVVIIAGAGNSMKNKLNEAVSGFLKQLKEWNAKSKLNIEVSVIHFNRDIKTVVEFKPLEEFNESDVIVNEFSEGSYMGQAILTGIDMAYKHRQKLIRESYGVARPNQPWVFLMTDGQPDAGVGATDEEKEEVRLAFEAASELIKSKEKDNKIVFVAAGIEHENSNVSVELLRKLTNFSERVITYDGQDTDFSKLLPLIIKGIPPRPIEYLDKLLADLADFNDFD